MAGRHHDIHVAELARSDTPTFLLTKLIFHLCCCKTRPTVHLGHNPGTYMLSMLSALCISGLMSPSMAWPLSLFLLLLCSFPRNPKSPASVFLSSHWPQANLFTNQNQVGKGSLSLTCRTLQTGFRGNLVNMKIKTATLL